MIDNYLQNVLPDPKKNCGPYRPLKSYNKKASKMTSDSNFGKDGNHDTIGMIALDRNGHIAAGTSTNGASFKIPG